ncbi:MAG TPA: hypothetical protein VF545_02400 [Thermoleophilaceae bacterium]|jgi:hypothetical protein
MRRAPIAALAVVCVLGLAGLALAAAADRRELAFTLDVRPVGIVAIAEPGQEACQRGVRADDGFDVVDALLGTFQRPGPPLAVTVRDARSRRTLATGRLPAGAQDNKPASVRVSPAVDAGRTLDVCVRDAGGGRLGFYGGSGTDSAESHATVNGRPLPGDLRLRFFRSRPRSALGLMPAMMRRAAVFRPDPVGAWTFWALLAAVAAGVPLLLAAALRRGGGE